WLALLIAGHSGLLVPSWSLGASQTRPGGRLGSRRSIVQLGALTGLTLLVGSVAASVRLLLPADATASATPSPLPTTPTPVAQSPTPFGSSSPGPSTSPAASGRPAATSTPAAQGIPISTVAKVQQRGSVDFQVPISAPAAMFPGDPAVLIALSDG